VITFGRNGRSPSPECAVSAATEVTPKFIAPADPATRWTAAPLRASILCLFGQLIDTDNAINVDVEATMPIRQAEVLNWLVNQQGIEPHIPVFDKSRHADATFSRDDFGYHHKRDCYICPARKELRQPQKISRVPRLLVVRNGIMRYRTSKQDCQHCSLSRSAAVRTRPPERSRAPSTRRSRYGARYRQEQGVQDLAPSAQKVEMLFVPPKRILKLNRRGLSGPNGAPTNSTSPPPPKNLRKLAKLIPLAAPIAAARGDRRSPERPRHPIRHAAIT
jgi:hypothetical protein